MENQIEKIRKEIRECLEAMNKTLDNSTWKQLRDRYSELKKQLDELGGSIW